MIPIFPKEYLARRKLYEQYLVGDHLENAPEEAVEAFEANQKWLKEQLDD